MKTRINKLLLIATLSFSAFLIAPLVHADECQTNLYVTNSRGDIIDHGTINVYVYKTLSATSCRSRVRWFTEK